MARKTATARQTTAKPANERTRLYRAVHAACRQNGLDDDDRKAMQVEICGKASLSDMTPAEIARMLDRLNRNSKAPAGHRAHIGKIRALWWSLYWLGKVESSDDRAIGAFVKRQTGINALRFVDHKSAPAVIEALKSWLERAGVVWPDPANIARIGAMNPGFTATHGDRIAVLRAINARLGAVGIPSEIVLGGDGESFGLTVDMLDIMIRDQGAKLRAAGV